MNEHDKLFLQLLYIFHTSAMQALGKIKNPITGNFEKNIEQAKQSIDMIEMLKDKTKNNLSEQLSKTTDSFLAEMRMNYVQESSTN